MIEQMIKTGVFCAQMVDFCRPGVTYIVHSDLYTLEYQCVITVACISSPPVTTAHLHLPHPI